MFVICERDEMKANKTCSRRRLLLLLLHRGGRSTEDLLLDGERAGPYSMGD
jgi:hypothetical protein